jgi:hypothetical protein
MQVNRFISKKDIELVKGIRVPLEAIIDILVKYSKDELYLTNSKGIKLITKHDDGFTVNTSMINYKNES